MAVRIRKSGEIVCAAMFPKEDGDTYIDDGLHYELAVIRQLLITDEDHFQHGLWWWAGQKEINKLDNQP
jgi:hypothetical protein